MKNSHYLRKSLSLTATLTLALAAIMTALAGGNGPVKGATQLRNSDVAGPSAPATPKADAMPCPKCKDEAVTRISTEKGHIQTALVSQQHLCKACETKLVTTGIGKAAHTEAKHTCGESAASDASCCVAQSSTKSAK